MTPINRKICVVTGTRAEFGLLRLLMEGINDTPNLDLQVAVTGMHLSPFFGDTWKEISEAGFPIHARVPCLSSQEYDDDMAMAVSRGISGFAIELKKLSPDLVIILGDRFEIFAAATAAMLNGNIIAHIGGGHITTGAIDDSMRHAITKMSHLHFTSNKLFADRILQLGEQPHTVFATGSLGIDAIRLMNFFEIDKLNTFFNLDLRKKTLLVTYHPETSTNDSPAFQIDQLISALESVREEYQIIFTQPNADRGRWEISERINAFAEKYPETVKTYDSLGQFRYLSTAFYVSAVVGNSSSGLIGAPSLKTPTINIGSRQSGRLKANSVIDCRCITEEIQKAFLTLKDQEFRDTVKEVTNPYGDGHAVERIISIIQGLDYSRLIPKHFSDITYLQK